ncbi:MAG: flagellar basal-body rod protein FlgF [Methylococcales bacterium]
MDRSLYVAMSGAKQILQAQTANANNLANVNTTGFRADLEQFRSMPVFGEGYPSRVYAMTERPATDFDAGPIHSTGRELDVAVKGEGWIAVEAEDGVEAYSRAGDFRITAEGQLQTGSGLPVLGEGGPIAIPPAEKVEIGTDGTITVVPLGGNAQTLAIVDRIKLVNPSSDQLEKRNDGLIVLKEGGESEASVEVELVSGALEGSNVSAIGAMVNMIEFARQYEMQIKMMKAVDENASASAQMMRVG